MRKYRRTTYEDRCQIYALSKRGASQECIAGVLGVSQSTLSREMCRNRGQRGYRFKQAEAKAQAQQAIRSRPRKLTAPLRHGAGLIARHHRAPDSRKRAQTTFKNRVWA
jgi:IS30 family transposase